VIQHPDDVPMEVITPEEEKNASKEDKGKPDGQFSLEW
jgi:hypothetical protein